MTEFHSRRASGAFVPPPARQARHRLAGTLGEPFPIVVWMRLRAPLLTFAALACATFAGSWFAAALVMAFGAHHGF